MLHCKNDSVNINDTDNYYKTTILKKLNSSNKQLKTKKLNSVF